MCILNGQSTFIRIVLPMIFNLVWQFFNAIVWYLRDGLDLHDKLNRRHLRMQQSSLWTIITLGLHVVICEFASILIVLWSLICFYFSLFKLLLVRIHPKWIFQCEPIFLWTLKHLFVSVMVAVLETLFVCNIFEIYNNILTEQSEFFCK